VNPSDSDCIRDCAAGRIAGLAKLVNRYERPLRAVLRARLTLRSILDDVVQETFVRVHHIAARKTDDGPLFPWLVGIALRIGMEQSRRESGIAELGEAQRETERPRDEADEELLAAVESLAEPYRSTVLLRYFSECSCAQIAEYLDVPIGTITKRLSRAHLLLRDELNKYETKVEARP
jgi:RNA polymerase sigma-70 factor (ECF subfamily)